MRRGGAIAAFALLALALGMASCKPSSLTPFGVGTREPETGGGVNGVWQGTTGRGGTVTFTIASDTVTDIRILHVGGTCTTSFELTAKTPPVENEAFVYDNELDSQGTIFVEGRFTSPETCVGSYSFEGRAVSECNLISGSDTFTATKSL